MIFTELTEEEFTTFVSKNKEDNFFQTIKKKKQLELGNITTYLVGVKKDNQVIGAALLCNTKHKFLGYTTYECYKGYILDYNDKDLVLFMTQEIKKFLKDKKALNLFIDPYIPNVTRDKDANIIEGIDNRPIKEYLESIGYHYIGEHNQVKWTYCLDIKNKTSQELFSEFYSSTRNNINKTINKYGLEIKTLTKEELPIFKEITEDTCKRRGFFDKSLTYYETMYDTFKEDVTFKVCYLNCDTYKHNLEKENIEFQKEIETLSDSKSNLKKKESLRKNIESNKIKLEQIITLESDKGNLIPLSCGMFMLYGKEIVYLFSGSYEEYMKFYGQYRLQWEMIKYAADNHYERYNFYGIQDVFNPKGKNRGVYEFKKGFGGYVEELLGSFELEISPLCKIYHLLKKIKR